MKKQFTKKMTNAIEPAKSFGKWGNKGCVGKCSNALNAAIVRPSIDEIDARIDYLDKSESSDKSSD